MSRIIFRVMSSGLFSAILLIFSSLGFAPTASANPTCSANVSVDSNGWGFENGRSCVSSASRPFCSANAVDNGNGWGWENNRSCRFGAGSASASASSGNSSTPICSSSAVDNGDGWGWENNRSCRFGSAGSSATAATSSSSSTPSCSSAAVSNGDGWGWENGRSCRYNGNASAVSGSASANTAASGSIGAASTAPTCSSAAVSNGNGWGWENNTSCRYRGNTGQAASVPVQSISAISQPVRNENGVRECSATAEDNGNGWGFEFGESCIWGSVQPIADRNSVVVAPPPVAAATVGFQDGVPICLTDASDGNGDGFGYENDRSCRVVAGRTATSANPLLNTRWCQPWAEISYGDYVLQNNTWNSSDVYYDRWSQCIELNGGPGNYVAKWDYNWLDRDEGNDFSVKSYPQVYYGRKTGNSQSGTPAKLGLPVNVNNVPNYKVRYRYSETGVAERNVALESFFHTSCEAEEWNKHFELMVWVNKPVIKTPGKLVTEVTIDGKEWDVYINPQLSWGYVAFVEKVPSTEGWLDWKKFVDWTRFQGRQYGIWDVGNTCMGAIEIGTETFWGNGTFTLHEFEVTR